MPRLSIYLLRQLAGPVALFSFLLTSVIWLSQSLRLLDLVINRGQSAPTFVYLTLLILPGLLVIILPLAYFFGSLYGLHKLNADSELLVMQASGFSRTQLVTPVLIAAAGMMVLTYICSLFLMPLGQRAFRDKEIDIRADIGAAILTEGVFNTPANGLTVFVRELGSDQQFHGILVHDSRTAHSTTYIARSGVLAQTPAGARLIMSDGTIEQSEGGGAKLKVLKFQRYVFDLDQFAGPTHQTQLETSERFLPDLLWPDPSEKLDAHARNVFFAEANNRLAAPLYCLAFAFIAFAAVAHGRGGRGAYALRLTGASIGAAALRIVGYGAQGLAARHPVYCIVLYLVPLLGMAAGIADINGFSLSTLVRRAPEPQEAAA
ncbi:MAG TPA: LPS export ABC transporter permease LptF [Rhizomicrobium sp.]|nr:LPS export ABC transporter permease LptF [Rhizomicrobium sp.]